MYEKIVVPMICNARTGECREFTGLWPIRVFFPWLWWMLL